MELDYDEVCNRITDLSIEYISLPMEKVKELGQQLGSSTPIEEDLLEAFMKPRLMKMFSSVSHKKQKVLEVLTSYFKEKASREEILEIKEMFNLWELIDGDDGVIVSIKSFNIIATSDIYDNALTLLDNLYEKLINFIKRILRSAEKPELLEFFNDKDFIEEFLSSSEEIYETVL